MKKPATHTLPYAHDQQVVRRRSAPHGIRRVRHVAVAPGNGVLEPLVFVARRRANRSPAHARPAIATALLRFPLAKAPNV